MKDEGKGMPNNETQEEQTSEQQTSEQQTSEQQTLEQQTLEQQTTENQTSENQTPEQAKPKKKMSKKKKVILIVVSSIVGLLLILLLAGYLMLRNYIGKINIVDRDDNDRVEVIDGDIEDEEDEEIDPNQTDSPEEDIKSAEEEIRKNLEENSTPIKSDEDVLNILLIGNDSRKDNTSGRSDAMILVSINSKTNKIIATSLLRDIYLQIPGKSNNRLNASYAFGGAKLLMQTVEQNFKIKIDRYVAVNFYAFMDAVDAVGGVNLEVSQEEIPIINNYIRSLNTLTGKDTEAELLTQPGQLLLTGKQALGYARNRYIGSDFERTARQRRVLEQVFNKVKKLGIFELNDLLNQILPQITTNLSEGEIFSLILSLPSYSGYDVEQWSIPVKGSYKFLRIQRKAVIGVDFSQNIKALHEKIYGEE